MKAIPMGIKKIICRFAYFFTFTIILEITFEANALLRLKSNSKFFQRFSHRLKPSINFNFRHNNRKGIRHLVVDIRLSCTN